MLRKSLKPLLCLIAITTSMESHAAVTVTAATGGTNRSADNAQNAAAPGFTTLGNIQIQENANTDFATPGGTLILSAPAGWRFNTNSGTATRQSGNRDMEDPTISVTESAITVTFVIGGTARSDRLTISGIQVQAIDGAALPSSGTILRTGGTATISGVTGATSFGSLSQIVGAAKSLAIQTEPSATATAGVAFAQQPVIRVLDQFNNLRSTANGAADNTTVVTAARVGGAGTLQGTLTRTASNGTATFSGLFHTVANPITIGFSSGALTGVTSQQITVQPNDAAELVFTTQPGNAIVGAPFGIQPALRTRDIYGNDSVVNLAANVPVTVSLSSGSGVLLGTLTQDIGTSAGNGEVTFSDLQIDAGSTDKQLTASAPGLTSALSDVFTVQKQSQAITFNPLAGKTYGESSFSVSATSSSLLPVSFQIAAGPASIVGDTITITGAGDVTVRAIQLGDDFYEAAPPVDQIFSVAPAVLQVSADNASRTYGAANPAFTAQFSGFVNGDTASVVSGSPSMTTSAAASSLVGESPFSIVAALGTLSAANYSFAFVNGELTITPASLVISPDNLDRTYGANNPALTGTLSGVQNADNLTATYVTIATPADLLGTYPIELDTLLDPDGKLANYLVTTNSGTLTITTAPLVVDVDDASRAYGSENPTFTGNITGLQNSDVITATYATAATASSSVGSHPIDVTLEDLGNKLANYAVVTNNGALTVTASALVVSADNATRVYGSANPTFSGNIAGLLNGDAITANYSTVATETTPVGDYPIVPSLTDPNGRLGNYSVTTNNGTLTISTAALVVSADSASRAYGSADPEFSGNVSGVLNDDAITASYSTVAVASSPIGDYPIVPSLNDPNNRLGNYSVTSNDGTLTITTAALVVSADDASRAYGAANPTFTGSVSGVANDDGITATYSTVATEASSVGDYAIVPSLNDPNNRLGNYSVTSNDGTLTIGVTALVVSADDVSRAYGSANPTFTGNISGLLNGDVITATYSTVATAASPVGSYPIVPDFTDANGRLANYSVTTNGTLTVTAASLTVTPDNATRIYGDANPVLTGNISGIQNSDDIQASYSTDAVLPSVVGSYDIAFELIDVDGKLSNYSVVTNTGTLEVTAASLVATADNKAKAVGTANPVLAGSLIGLKNSDDITLVLETTAIEESLVGDYPITIAALLDPNGKLSNYSVTTNDGILSVQGIPVIVSVSPTIVANEGETVEMEVQAGGSNLSFQWSFAGDSIPGATDSSYSIANVKPSHVGTYEVTVSNLLGSVTGSVEVQVTGDSTAPALKVLTPGNNKIYTSASLVATGTASDLVRIVSVKYNLNNGGLTEVDNKASSGKLTNWNSTVTLTPGTNRIFFVATDLAGNATTSAVLQCFYHTASPLTIVTNGNGSVFNPTSAALYDLNNTNLFVGRSYKLLAKESAAPQWILTNWTDGNGNVLQTNNLTVNFTMQENMVVNANFIPNPFYRFAGVYNGLFSDTNNGVAYQSAGYVTLKVSPKLGFSGKLFLNGNALSVSGKFQIDGTATVSTKDRFKKFEKPEVTLNFALDFSNASDSLSGTVAQGGDWVAELNADRVIWTTNVVEQATEFTNSYTMLLSGFTNKDEGPVGSGYGSVSIDRIGKVKLKGESADRQALKQSTVVSKDGAWPVFAPLYKEARFHSVTLKKITETKGFALGWLNFATNAIGNMAPAGNLHWINTGWTNLYTAGFTNQNVDVVGSRWRAPVPKSGIRAVDMTNVVISFTNGNLAESFEGKFLVSTNTALVALKTELYPNKLKGSLAAKTGVFKGSFEHPANLGVSTKYAGALLQDYNFGSGFFMGPTEGGSVELDPILE